MGGLLADSLGSSVRWARLVLLSITTDTEPSMTRLRWGILSTARIGVRRVIPAIQRSQPGGVPAVASREANRAAEVASRFGIPRAHGTYEGLLADPEIDAIYNPLPNSLHAEWAIRAAEAGRHGLCENPLARGAAEGRG